jgi:hypothetical protein
MVGGKSLCLYNLIFVNECEQGSGTGMARQLLALVRNSATVECEKPLPRARPRSAGHHIEQQMNYQNAPMRGHEVNRDISGSQRHRKQVAYHASLFLRNHWGKTKCLCLADRSASYLPF